MLIKAKIIAVENGATDPETGITWDYFIRAKLQSGKKILIFDSEPFDLHDYIGKEIDLLIHASCSNIAKTEDLNKTNKYGDSMIIQGRYIKDYKITEEWSRLKFETFPALDTEDGLFILGFFHFRDRKINNYENIALKIGRFDLIDWYFT